MLPSKHGFSLRDVRDALEEEGILTPDFPKGEFEVIRGYKDFQVAIFKYDRDSVAGCRTTSSKQHRALRPVHNTTLEPASRRSNQRCAAASYCEHATL